jgi:hypothetical protein
LSLVAGICATRNKYAADIVLKHKKFLKSSVSREESSGRCFFSAAFVPRGAILS